MESKSVIDKQISALIKEIDDKINTLKAQIGELEQERDTKKASFFAGLIENGWTKFEFYSFHYTKKKERRHLDIEEIYYFHPSVEVPAFDHPDGFAHGTITQTHDYEKFETFLDSLDDTMFYVDY